MAITKVFGRYIYDSRGNPTVEVELTTDKGTFRSAVPSGASTGSSEALELRDKDQKKWGGKGVLTAVANVNDVIAPALVKAGLDVTDQKAIDDFLIKLDGTDNKSKLGANAILGVSLSATRAGAAERGIPLYEHIRLLANIKAEPYVLPIPFQNIVNGGMHAGGDLAIQEFMIAPIHFSSFSEAFRANTEIYHILKKSAAKKYGSSAGNVGDEGGIAPDLDRAEQALDLIVEAIDAAGYSGKIKIAIDPASSEFYKNGKYDLKFKNPHNDGSQRLDYKQLASYYHELLEKYPIVDLEDPFAEADWPAWQYFYQKEGSNIEIVSDDLTVTNTRLVTEAIEKKAANALLLKVNQIGTITESINAAKLAYSNGWGVMISHRSGETEDPFIADLAVGLRTGQIKSGAPARSERLAKYNQFLRIEQELGDKAIYAGTQYRKSAAI